MPRHLIKACVQAFAGGALRWPTPAPGAAPGRGAPAASSGSAPPVHSIPVPISPLKISAFHGSFWHPPADPVG